jgi:uncharacterized protein YidB (DUF937 family)
MGLLDGIVGGVVGAGLATAAHSIIEKNGGVQGVVDQFEKNGLGGIARSWVGNGPNDPITADQVKAALGVDTIKSMAEKAGISVDEAANHLSSILPGLIDKMTPNGKPA